MFSNLSSKVSFLIDRLNACSFYIGRDCIDFVESFSHHIHIISAKLGDVSDIIKGRNDFKGQVNNILFCYFKNLNSFVKYNCLVHIVLVFMVVSYMAP